MKPHDKPRPLDYAPPAKAGVALYRRVLGGVFFGVAILCVIGAIKVDNDAARVNAYLFAGVFAFAGTVFRFGNLRLFSLIPAVLFQAV